MLTNVILGRPWAVGPGGPVVQEEGQPHCTAKAEVVCSQQDIHLWRIYEHGNVLRAWRRLRRIAGLRERACRIEYWVIAIQMQLWGLVMVGRSPCTGPFTNRRRVSVY